MLLPLVHPIPAEVAGKSVLRSICRVERDIPIHWYVETIADWNFDRRMNVEILSCDLGTEIGHLPPNGTAGDFAGAGIGENGTVLIL